MPFLLSFVVVTFCAVVTSGLHAALLETCGWTRTDRDRSCPASQRAPYRHGPCGNPRLTFVSEGNPLRRLLLGIEEKLEEKFVLHGSLSFQMDLPVTSEGRSRLRYCTGNDRTPALRRGREVWGCPANPHLYKKRKGGRPPFSHSLTVARMNLGIARWAIWKNS